jgi:hypothetical protein
MQEPRNQGVFDSPNTQITDSFNVYHQKPPPADHPNAITCPQCEGITWRMTDNCIHCGFNITAYYQEQARLERISELKAQYSELKKRGLPLLLLMFVACIAMLSCTILKPSNHFIYWLPIVCMLIIAAFFKPIAEKMDDIKQQIRELSL